MISTCNILFLTDNHIFWAREMAIKNEEEALIRSFVIRSKQDRFLEMLANPKRRAKATAQLAHFAWLDPRWIVPIENNDSIHP